MRFVQQVLRRVRAHRREVLASVFVGLFLAALGTLQWAAEHESDARKSAEQRAFEKSPDDWLDRERNITEFRAALDDDRLEAVGLATAHPGLVLYTLRGGEKASASVPGCSSSGCSGTVLERLGDGRSSARFALVHIDIDPRTASRRTLDLLTSLVSPLLVVAGMAAALVVATRLQTGMGGAASKLAERPELRFADAIGNDEAKAALNRVKAFLHDPARYAKLGAAAPRGVLLVGAPGTGKTLLAKALAGESKANFIAVDGSYFTASFYGAGVAKVKALFKLARKHAPCVLFIDEVDGIGRRTRSGEGGGAESELNRIINRVLVEMDGFDALDNVVVVAATNHENNIDEAMRRPGRFDMLVRLALPTLPERRRLFELYLGKVTSDGSADARSLARMTAGVSPAEIANIVNKAASTAAEAGCAAVTAEHVLRAVETHQLGGEVSSIKELFTDDLRARLAYHESGHALVGHWLRAGLVERVTIEPRGQALGVTYMTRETEDPLYNQAELTSRLAMILAGRETELLVFGSVSTGASDDLKRASQLAIDMVGSLGFSDAFGLLSVAGVPSALLGPDIQAALLAEARALLETSQATCREVLGAHRDRLDRLAGRLLEVDVLSGAELADLLGATSEAAAPPVRPVVEARAAFEPETATEDRFPSAAVPALCFSTPSSSTAPN